MGSTGSQYIATEDFTTGQLGSPIKLPYAPNSMVISQDGSTIYMGSSGGLEVLNTAGAALAGVYQAIQGNVLAVAPNNSYAVITDPTRGTVSLVTNAGAVFSTFNGVGTRAQWTPDSNNLYVTTSGGQLLTYSTFVGWESTTPDETYTDVAVTVPAFGAFFAGPSTEARSYCPLLTSSSSGTPPTTTNIFTPPAGSQATPTTVLGVTTDGLHLLGATTTTLNDFTITAPAIPGNQPNGPGVCTTITGAATIITTPVAHSLAAITATAINGVLPASNSSLAAITYTGTSGLLPLYSPASGTFNNVPLSGGATTAPVAGVFSTDNTQFYAGTSGDNIVHIVTITGATGTDSGTIVPGLTGVNGGTATPNLIVSRPRRAKS